MEKESFLNKTREKFAADIFATEIAGAVIDDAVSGEATCTMQIKPIHKNAAGGVMGGAIFTLADFAFAVAANCAGGITVSLSSQINFTGAAKGEKLIARASCKKSGRTTCCYIVEVEDDLKNSVAEVLITGFIKQHPDEEFPVKK